MMLMPPPIRENLLEPVQVKIQSIAWLSWLNTLVDKFRLLLCGRIDNGNNGAQQSNLYIQSGYVAFDSSKPFDGNMILADIYFPIVYATPPIVQATVKEWDLDVPPTHIPTGIYCSWTTTSQCTIRLKVPSALPSGVIYVAWLSIGQYKGDI